MQEFDQLAQVKSLYIFSFFLFFPTRVAVICVFSFCSRSILLLLDTKIL